MKATVLTSSSREFFSQSSLLAIILACNHLNDQHLRRRDISVASMRKWHNSSWPPLAGKRGSFRALTRLLDPRDASSLAFALAGRAVIWHNSVAIRGAMDAWERASVARAYDKMFERRSASTTETYAKTVARASCVPYARLLKQRMRS